MTGDPAGFGSETDIVGTILLRPYSCVLSVGHRGGGRFVEVVEGEADGLLEHRSEALGPPVVERTSDWSRGRPLPRGRILSAGPGGRPPRGRGRSPRAGSIGGRSPRSRSCTCGAGSRTPGCPRAWRWPPK